MSFQVEGSNALRAIRLAARATGMTEAAVALGVMTMWAAFFDEDFEVYTEVHMRGFGFEPNTLDALQAFGLIARVADNDKPSWTVGEFAHEMRRLRK